MNEIAAFLDERNKISSFTEAKFIKIYFKENDLWAVKNEIILKKSGDIKGINETRNEFRNLADKMGECKIIIVNKAFGIPYSVFYSEDFSVWELEGNPLEFLDLIIAKEKDEEERGDNEEQIAVRISSGYYSIDLIELELSNPEMSSKQAINPYLDKEEVKKVQIHCCHIPPWLQQKEAKGEIKLKIDEVKRNDYNIVIEKY